MDVPTAIEAAERSRYLERTPASAALHARARAVMPGGDTRTGTFHAPYPLFIAEGPARICRTFQPLISGGAQEQRFRGQEINDAEICLQCVWL